MLLFTIQKYAHNTAIIFLDKYVSKSLHKN